MTDDLRPAVIRVATLRDADDVVALWVAAAGPTRLPSDAGAVRLLLDRDPDALLVADDDGVIVGTMIIGWDGWRCHLYRMAVADSHRRRGLGGALLEAGLERARSLGARRIDAMVDDANDTGIQFWRAREFEVDTHDRRWSRLIG